MNWTTEYPTRPGYYWLRNCVLNTWRDDELIPGPAIVEIDTEGDLYCIGSDSTIFKCWVLSAEWFGPIQSPEQESECIVGGHPPGCRGHIKQQNEK